MRSLWLPFFLCFLLAACGGGDKTYPVAGVVTFDGTPVGDGNDAIIRFETSDGKGSTGESFLKEGKYLVNLVEGKYKVAISWNKKTGKKLKGAIAGPGQESEEIVSMIPAKFGSQSTLSAEVNPSKLNHDFNLKK